MGTHNVKIHTKKRTKWGLASGCFEEFSGWQVGNNGVKHHFFWDQGPSLTRKLQHLATHFNAQCHVNSPLLCCILRVNAWQLPTSSNAARMQLLHKKGLSTWHWAIAPVWVGLNGRYGLNLCNDYLLHALGLFCLSQQLQKHFSLPYAMSIPFFPHISAYACGHVALC